jgi:DNA-directed RNA polymerase subunit beta
MNIQTVKNLKKNGIIKIGVNVKNEDILIGKIKKTEKANFNTQLLNAIFGKSIIKDTSIKLHKSVCGTVIKVKIIKRKLLYIITIYISERRQIKIGDKISGRHGNKGIISKILKVEDMPYLQDGTPIDIILNPLGIPSRMNVGQLYECFLGMAGKNLKENYKIQQFSETGKNQISQKLVYNKLYEAKIKTGKDWLFVPNNPGKSIIFDGRTGSAFNQPVATGYSYILKLMHLVDDKLNARMTGPYSLIIKQPVKGKAKNGGQRFGEMEVWAIEGYGAAYTLQELLTIKSDDIINRSKTMIALIKGTVIPDPNIPESFKTLILELQCLCLEISIYKKNLITFF